MEDLARRSDDHVLIAATLRGGDLPGDLVLGDRALQQAQSTTWAPESKTDIAADARVSRAFRGIATTNARQVERLEAGLR